MGPKQRKKKHMALNIEFEGYVNEVKTFDWGRVAKLSHAQRAKNQTTGEWETVGKDYIDVTLPDDAISPTENTIVNVRGSLKVSTYQKLDGTTGVGMKVRAKEISPVVRGSRPATQVSDTW